MGMVGIIFMFSDHNSLKSVIKLSIIKDIMIALKNIIVTGSNKGIGFGIVNYLAARQGWNIIMAVRNIHLGEQSKNELQQKHPNAKIHVEKLDLQDNKSIDDFVSVIKGKYGHIDVLVNNAGIAAKGDAFDSEVARFTFQTNFYGTIELTEKLLPLISNNGKVVTVGSTAAIYAFKKISNQNIKKRFQKENLSKNELFQLIQEFKDGVADNTYAQKGWPKSCYGISKLGINLYHSILGHNQDVSNRNIQVYVCCPGYVKTDMSSHKGNLTVEQGILTPTYLIELPSAINKDLQGRFFYLQKPISFFQM